MLYQKNTYKITFVEENYLTNCFLNSDAFSINRIISILVGSPKSFISLVPDAFKVRMLLTFMVFLESLLVSNIAFLVINFFPINSELLSWRTFKLTTSPSISADDF